MAQSQDGLNAAGFLLLAEGHLRKAKERLAKRGRPPRRILAYETTVAAIDETRRALDLLKEEDKELCKS